MRAVASSAATRRPATAPSRSTRRHVRRRVSVVAAHADPVRVAVPAAGPVIVIVHHHRANDLVPSAADVAALPSASLGAVASLVPYRVVTPSSIADRWLSGGRGVTAIEGLPFYRRGDGGDATSLLPSHAFGAVAVSEAMQAPWYGDRAGAGVVDASLFDRTDRARATNADASLEVGNVVNALAAESFDPDGTRRVAAVSGGGRAGPIDASAVAIAGTAAGTNYAGAGADVRAATRTLAIGAHVGLTSDDTTASGAIDDGSVADVDLDVSGRGPNAIAVRARWRDERGVVGELFDDHHDAALVLGTSRGSAVRVSAAVALTYGDEHAYDVPAAAALAVLPSLASTLRWAAAGRRTPPK